MNTQQIASAATEASVDRSSFVSSEQLKVIWAISITVSALLLYIGVIAPYRLSEEYERELAVNTETAKTIVAELAPIVYGDDDPFATANYETITRRNRGRELTRAAESLHERMTIVRNRLEHEPQAQLHPIWGLGGPILIIGGCLLLTVPRRKV